MKNNIIDTVCNSVAIAFTVVQTEQIFQIISLVLTIISITVSLIMRLVTWYKNSKKDGKIDKDELKEGIDIITGGIEDISNTISKDKPKDKETKE